MGKLKVK